jgi:retron-type reverse transcriptase
VRGISLVAWLLGAAVFEQLCSWDNLVSAYRKASRGKRGYQYIAAFEHRMEDNMAVLREELVSGRYRPGGYASFFIHEPKRRLISAAPFRDRVIHHALCNVIEPMFEKLFSSDSYANRKRKGTHRAIGRCQHMARRYRYVLQCDIRQFFPSIDHEVLRDLLAERIGDSSTLHLIDLILASGIGILSDVYHMTYFPGDDLFSVNRARGLPIGNLTSQFWANVYLNPVDHFIRRQLGCMA